MSNKRVTFSVDIDTTIPSEVNPEDVTFDIDLSRVIPMANGKPIGKVTGYTTTAHFEND